MNVSHFIKKFQSRTEFFLLSRRLGEILSVVQRLFDENQLDFLDMSLWDVNKLPEEKEFKDATLMSHFTGLKRGNTMLGVAGKITTAKQATACLEAGCDFVLIGRAAIFHHDFPQRCLDDAAYEAPAAATVAQLHAQGVSDSFVAYLKKSFKQCVLDDK
jgi:2,4-dienoyl-CoA reductase-like NADH-dependent reductase (Old Yellow Enzyme family)